MEPPNDATPVETYGGVLVDGRGPADLQPHPPYNIHMNLSHGGRYVRYNFSGNIFEVTAKYSPLIMLLGGGASRIVW